MSDGKMKFQELNSLIQLSTSQPLKNVITIFLLSVSLFFSITSYSAWCSFLLHYVKFYVLAIPWQLLNHALGKGYIFLICNVILLFIAKTSSLVGPLSGHDIDDLLEENVDDGLQTSILEKEDLVGSAKRQDDEDLEVREEGRVDEDFVAFRVSVSTIPKSIDLKEEHIENEVFDVGKEEEEGGNEEHIATYILGDDDQGEENFDNGVYIIKDEENDNEYYQNASIVEEEKKGVEDEIELLSTEELNKKFEEFIRKMKQELRIEAQ